MVGGVGLGLKRSNVVDSEKVVERKMANSLGLIGREREVDEIGSLK